MSKTVSRKTTPRSGSNTREREDGDFLDQAWDLLEEWLAMAELRGTPPRWVEVRGLLVALCDAFDPAFDPMEGVNPNRSARQVQRDADTNSARFQRALAAALVQKDPDLARRYAALVRDTAAPPGLPEVETFRPFTDAVEQGWSANGPVHGHPQASSPRRIIKRRRTPSHREQDEMFRQWTAYKNGQPGRALLAEWLALRPACLADWKRSEIEAALAAARKRRSRHPRYRQL